MKIENYEINEDTLAIISLKSGNCEILEGNYKYRIDKKSLSIIDDSCKFFGSSYNGRKDGSISIIGNSYKVPIIIEETSSIIFFPTTSPDDNDCIWLSANNIKTLIQERYNTTRIIFTNNKELYIPLSVRAIQNQLYRASRLNLLIRNRQIPKNY